MIKKENSPVCDSEIEMNLDKSQRTLQRTE